MPVAFSHLPTLADSALKELMTAFANQSIMTIRSARTQSVELTVPLTTLNISFGCLRAPSLAFPERPRDGMSHNKETQPGWAAVHTPTFPLLFFSGSGEPGKSQESECGCARREERKEKEERREEGRERQK